MVGPSTMLTMDTKTAAVSRREGLTAAISRRGELTAVCSVRSAEHTRRPEYIRSSDHMKSTEHNRSSEHNRGSQYLRSTEYNRAGQPGQQSQYSASRAGALNREVRFRYLFIFFIDFLCSVCVDTFLHDMKMHWISSEQLQYKK
jgi:hypothetical protein